MFATLRMWLDRIFEQEETVVLVVLLLTGLAILLFIGDVMMPVLAALVFAYMVQGFLATLQRIGAPRWLALTVSLLLFMTLFFGAILGIFPLVWQQLVNLLQEAPKLLLRLQEALLLLPERYDFVTAPQVQALVDKATLELANAGQKVVSISFSLLPNLFSFGIYIILIPMLVFFFLKDKDPLLRWFASFLPARRPLLNTVWEEMNKQVANYIRGKAIEIMIVGCVTYAAFVMLDLNYAALLALGVGLSVVIPYIGAVAITVPVLLVGFLQFGWTADFATVAIAYFVIQGIDGNILVPLLFSEAVNLHPVAIILSVLVFGGFWGLWGVFFAIPLATLIKAILNAWPKPSSMAMLEEE